MNDSQTARARRAKVMVVSASVGAGHAAAAQALCAGLESQSDRIDHEFVDVLAFAPRWFRSCYAGGYALAVTKFPLVFGAGYWLADLPTGPRRGPSERLRLWFERRALWRFRRYLADRRSTPPGAEPQPEVAARVVAAMTDIARAPRAAGEATLVISHGGAIRTFIHEVTGTAPPPLENGAVFVARYVGGQFVAVTRA